VPVAVEELMEKIPAYADRWKTGDATDQATARRTFERDKDDLRKAGIPLRTVKYTIDGEPVEGYEISRRDFYLPYLKLVAEESGGHTYASRHRAAETRIAEKDAPLALEALRRVGKVPSFPLREEARSAYRKIAFDLDPHAFADEPSVLFVESSGAAELTDQLRTLSDALLARKRVKFRYHGIQRGEETQRDVAPYGVLFQHGHWYLIGEDATRGHDVRVFRVGRMEQIKPNTKQPNTADYTIPADFRLQDYVGRSPWELGNRDEEPLSAIVYFRFPQSVLAERNGYGRMVETRDDGSTLRVFDVQQVNPFLRWVLSLESDAQIVSPPELQTQLQHLAREIAAAHRENADARD
jgi:predicted DNA-binding transcriptional regulator YafY